MIVMGLFALITIAILAESGLKPNFYKYITMLFSVICGLVFAFSYFESLAVVISRINWFPSAANGIAFVLLFMISFAILKLLGDFTIRPEVKLPKMIDRALSIVCALIFSVLVTGTIVVFLSLMPMQPKYPYPRFANKPIITDSNYDIQPDKSFLATDEFVTKFYSMLSAGCFSGKTDFGVVHNSFIDSNFLNRSLYAEGVSPLSGKDAIKISNSPDAVRKAHKLLKYTNNSLVPKINGKVLYVVKMSVSQKKVENGGIIEKGAGYDIGPAQLRLICNKNYEDGSKGKGQIAFPVGYLDNNRKLEKFDLKEKLNLLPFKPDKNTDAELSVVFYVPEGYAPVAVGFRQSTIKALPKELNKEMLDSEE